MRYALLVLLLTGCATQPDASDSSAYFLVSKGGASAFYSVFVGKIDYCKVTQNNLKSSAFNVSVQYDGKVCNVEAIANDKD